MKYILIEDELLAAKRLRDLIQKLRPEYTFVSKFDTVEGASIGLQALNYDVIFMDIQLGDGNSFDIFDQIRLTKPVIFTTAYDEYALKAFKINSIDYLLKPIDEGELRNALEKLEQRNAQSPGQDLILNQLMKSLQPRGKERFVVRIGDHLHTVQTSDIQLIYSQDKGTYLYTQGGKKYLVDYTLDTVEDLLDKSEFFRISRKFLVNQNFISDMIAFSNSRLEIKVKGEIGEQIIVARERVQDFKTWYDR